MSAVLRDCVYGQAVADALGVLVPQLFCLPVLAVRLALEKKEL